VKFQNVSDIYMSIYYSNRGSQTIRNSLYFSFDVFGEMQKKIGELEWMRQFDPQHDPEKPPPKEHGDKYYVIGALVGAIVGGIIGGVLSRFGGLIMFDIIAGTVVGGIVGIMVGSLVRKHVLNKESRDKVSPKQE
jgi:hypothetical protein